VYRSHEEAGSVVNFTLSAHFLISLISSFLSFSGSTSFLGFLGFSAAALGLGFGLVLVSVALDLGFDLGLVVVAAAFLVVVVVVVFLAGFLSLAAGEDGHAETVKLRIGSAGVMADLRQSDWVVVGVEVERRDVWTRRAAALPTEVSIFAM
jgi:hypothetical protein